MGLSVFVLSDIEGSTRLWSAAPDAMGAALCVHDGITSAAVRGAKGVLVKHTGDGFLARFDTVGDAIGAAVDVQRQMTATELSGLELRLRIAVHAGEAEQRGGDWFGTAINRTARLLELGHGGQILMSAVVARLVDDTPIEGCTLLDLGVHTLRDLTVPEHVFQVVAAGLAAQFPAVRAAGETAGRRLPRRRSSFIGRREEMAQAPMVVDDHRLVTLVGPGGIGKTRLAQEIAIVRTGGGEAVWWVDLTLADDPEAFAAVVLDATNARGPLAADLVAVVAGSLRASPGLVVLDNCEHVLSTVGGFVDGLLDAVPMLSVLATSRRPLGLDGEHVWRLAPLELPPPGSNVDAVGMSDAVMLLVERARQARPDFVIDATNAASIVEICRRLDGIPLALELAAARLRHVAVADLFTSLEGTFPLLRDEQSHPARHRALADSLRWSHDALPSEVQELLWALAFFIGPFTGAEAASVADTDGAVLVDRLGELVDASLIEFDVGSGTYRLLETVRQFALATAAEHGRVAEFRDRHLARCIALAMKWAADRTIVSLDVVDDIVRERANLIAAIEWSCEPGRQPALSLIAPLAAAAIAQRLVADTSSWSSRVLAALDGPERTAWTQAVAACARLRMELGDFEFVEHTIPVAAAIARASGDAPTEASCMMVLGAASFVAGDAQWSSRLIDAAELAASADNDALELEIRAWLAWSLAVNGQAADADVQLARCAQLGVYDSIHAHQCAVAEHVSSTWRGRPAGDERFGPIRVGSGDPIVWFASALRSLYTGDTSDLDEPTDHDGSPPLASLMRPVVVALHILLVEDDPARAASEVRAVAEEPWFGRPLFPIVWLAATLSLAARDTDAARSLTEIADSVAAPDGWGEVSVAMLRSELALTDGDLATAERDAIDALTVAVRQGLRPWICDIVEQIAYIDIAAERTDRAITLGRAAADERDASGYRYRLAHRRAQWNDRLAPHVGSDAWQHTTADLDGVAEWLLRSPGRRARARTGWHALTRTELEVVDHVRDGLTNAEIGARMFVSPATVKSHLEHIYAKLGVRGRVQLLAVAALHRNS